MMSYRDTQMKTGMVYQATKGLQVFPDQQRLVVSLANARTDELITEIKKCDFMLIEDKTAGATGSIRLNSLDSPPLDISKYRTIRKSAEYPIERVYLTNTAQPGASITFIMGGDSAFEASVDPTVTIAGTVAIKDVSGNQINPAEMASTPALYAIVCVSANTEYSQALPDGTKKFMVKCRDTSSTLRTAWVTGKVATPTDPYNTVTPNNCYWEDHVKLTSKTLYIASDSAGAVAEVTAWT